MNYESDLIYKIAISRIKGVGDITAKKLISHCGSAELVFKENKKSLENIPNQIGSIFLVEIELLLAYQTQLL